MDYSTISNKLTDKYKSPIEFIEDMRLVYKNAQLYNPKEHNVHLTAVKTSDKLEKMLKRDPFLPMFTKWCKSNNVDSKVGLLNHALLQAKLFNIPCFKK